MGWLDLSFWQWLGAALALVVTVVGIKFAFTLDLNRYLEGRRERSEERLKALCPHTQLSFLESGEIFAEPRFNNLPMTLNCVCSQCGFVVHDEQSAIRIAEDWASNPDGWVEADKRFREAYSKFYGI